MPLTRKQFVSQLALLTAGSCMGSTTDGMGFMAEGEPVMSEFSKHLQPVGRRLEMEGYYVWCNSPIEGPDGKIHLFFSRWKEAKKMGGWLNGCEICHAVADNPEAPFEYVGTVLAPRAGFWDSTTCHNPHIQKVDGKYCLFYMGNCNAKTDTKRIGLAVSDSLYGPWQRPDAPLLLPGPAGSWDDHCTTNPAFIKHPNGDYWLYYKSWNTQEYLTATNPLIKGNRKYGLAIAKKLMGPYIKHGANPVIDFSKNGNDNQQFEDAFVWREGKRFNMIARDMGFFNHEYGLLMQSKDGIKWREPEVAFIAVKDYVEQPPPPPHLKKYGRFERPQLLFQNGKATHLFTTSQGGKYMTSTPFIFKIV